MSLLADLVVRVMARACRLIRDAGCCGLLSPHFEFRWDDERDDFRISFRNPLFPLWRWAIFYDLRQNVAVKP